MRLDQLTAEYEALAPALRGGGRSESWIDGLRREFATLVEIRHANEPSARPDARYRRALARLRSEGIEAHAAAFTHMFGSFRAPVLYSRLVVLTPASEKGSAGARLRAFSGTHSVCG